MPEEEEGRHGAHSFLRNAFLTVIDSWEGDRVVLSHWQPEADLEFRVAPTPVCGVRDATVRMASSQS
jgi:hypothetical protein